MPSNCGLILVFEQVKFQRVVTHLLESGRGIIKNSAIELFIWSVLNLKYKEHSNRMMALVTFVSENFPEWMAGLE